MCWGVWMALTSLSRSIDGYVAIVTGAASGMGEATAKLFADEGAKVAAIDVNEEGLQRVVAEMPPPYARPSMCGNAGALYGIALSNAVEAEMP